MEAIIIVSAIIIIILLKRLSRTVVVPGTYWQRGSSTVFVTNVSAYRVRFVYSLRQSTPCEMFVDDFVKAFEECKDDNISSNS